jgi:hypothetical protein
LARLEILGDFVVTIATEHFFESESRELWRTCQCRWRSRRNQFPRLRFSHTYGIRYSKNVAIDIFENMAAPTLRKEPLQLCVKIRPLPGSKFCRPRMLVRTFFA